jgi:hypothetical protein
MQSIEVIHHTSRILLRGGIVLIQSFVTLGSLRRLVERKNVNVVFCEVAFQELVVTVVFVAEAEDGRDCVASNQKRFVRCESSADSA